MPIALKVNGWDVSVDVEESTPILYVLRNDLGLSGPRFGCGLGQCGACTVHLAGRPVRACVTPVASAQGQELVTLEGLGSRTAPHPVQAAFIAEQAAQCGYCANGMIMAAAALLTDKPRPTEAEIRRALNANLCRCGSHTRIIMAVLRAAGKPA